MEIKRPLASARLAAVQQAGIRITVSRLGKMTNQRLSSSCNLPIRPFVADRPTQHSPSVRQLAPDTGIPGTRRRHKLFAVCGETRVGWIGRDKNPGSSFADIYVKQS